MSPWLQFSVADDAEVPGFHLNMNAMSGGKNLRIWGPSSFISCRLELDPPWVVIEIQINPGLAWPINILSQ